VSIEAIVGINIWDACWDVPIMARFFFIGNTAEWRTEVRHWSRWSGRRTCWFVIDRRVL